jgi:hypothetical protein
MDPNKTKTLKPTIIPPDPKNVTPDNFVRWYDQKTFGSKEGSLGMKKGTEGKLMQFQEFSKVIKGLQSK